MILDTNLLLSGAISAAGALTGQLVTTASALSTNTIDMASLALGGNQATDVGAGEALEISISVLVAPASCTDVQFQLIQADDAALTSNVQVINQTAAFAIASLPAGTIVPLHYDRAAPYAPKRYVGVRYVTTGTTITAMSVVAGVVKNVQDVKNMLYKSGFSVT